MLLRPARPALLALCCAAAITAAAAACATHATPAARAPTVTPAGAGDATTLTAEIEAQFRRSAAAWNRGDLDAFMSDYARGDSTTFVARGHLRHGWDAIRAGYAARFAPGAQRDSLGFEEFSVRPLGATHAAVFGRFVLARDGKPTSSGPFTLIMERRSDGWKILHDHTSSD